MPGYLTAEWFDRLGAPGQATDEPPDPTSLVIQHTVTGGPDGDVTYHVRLHDGRAQVVRGRAGRADVTFREDYATAAAIAGGALAAPVALLAGDLVVGGDLAALVARRDSLVTADPVPPALRAETTY